ncbi:flagellar hook-basal body complex protein FliE [Thermococcus sp. GR7]|uniref:dephospho-CoA kinase n=1 Tax=unclassified Thermococcus TaxID=2627626 RepID=UPI001431E51C|nr:MULTISPECIES: dephospho-CoA kinase [unclassified Thermococcus]NJE46820.1 flagellar hook-basal body complex protein FliE [Thermococcus sp. GR7]NJE78317.1 flagellar hook-basal body complex protein FliE [Thermococcus sp. GR4]NJF23386.1 flagellar hook-basal body complex protein FliE [Thermococcus sp. GR5]
MIIIVTGMPGSGKSKIVKEFEKRGVPSVSMGDVVREETAKRGLELTKENVAKVSIRLRQELGQNAVAKLAVEKVRELLRKNKVVVIDGVRSLDEVGTFRSAFPSEEIIIVAVHTPPHMRFERLKARGRHDDPQSWEDFEERDWKELKFGIGNVIAMADYMIVNDCPKEEYERRVQELVEKILAEH